MVDLSKMMQDAQLLDVIDKSADECSTLSAQNSAQAMQIDELKRERDALVAYRAELSSRVALVEAERDALKADAERYRWLKDCSYGTPGWERYDQIVNGVAGVDWDAAIDSAMREGK